jgi:peroxiredoxin
MSDNLKFKEQNGISFPLVSDTGESIKEKYGRGRVTYLIDKNGIIQFVQKGVPDNQVFLDMLKAAE